MGRLVPIVNDKPQWTRDPRIGGGDAAAIMGCDPYTNLVWLWRYKLGLEPPKEQNQWMLRGLELESLARTAYEAHTGRVLQPLAFEHQEHPQLVARVDGVTLGWLNGIEIKCPGDEKHAMMRNGIVPRAWVIQIAHYQLVVGGEWECVSYRNGEIAIVPVPRDEALISRLLARELAFYRCIEEKTSPTESQLRLHADGI